MLGVVCLLDSASRPLLADRRNKSYMAGMFILESVREEERKGGKYIFI